MAKVTITVEDLPSGEVTVVIAPNVSALINLAQRSAGLTSGQAYALSAARHIRDEAKKEQRKATKTRVILPPGLGDN